jgi:hypothetical protein
MAYSTPDIEEKSPLNIDASFVTEESLNSILQTQYSHLANQKFYEIEAAEVIKVITREEDLERIPGTADPDFSYYGAIKARQFISEKNTPEQNLPWRFPLNTSMRAMPLKGETVLCVNYLDEPYYIDVINRSRNPNINDRDGGISNIGSKEQQSEKLNYYTEVDESGGNPTTPPPGPDGKVYDEENIFTPLKIQNLQMNSGDTLLQGRFGNVIRFSSDQKNTAFSSNIKISTGQLYNETDLTVLQKLEDNPEATVEQNINSDASSIYLTENETVDLSVELVSKVLPGRILSNRSEFSGAQVILNSDNVTMNARLNDVHLIASQNVNMTARRRINLEAPIINLGDRTASQALIKGDIFMEVFKTLLVSLKTFASRCGDITAPNPNNKIIELELAAESLKTQIDVLVLPFLSETLSKRNYTS